MSYWSVGEPKREERLTVCLSKEERQRVIENAKAHKLNMSEFVRRAILGEMEDRISA